MSNYALLQIEKPICPTLKILGWETNVPVQVRPEAHHTHTTSIRKPRQKAGFLAFYAHSAKHIAALSAHFSTPRDLYKSPAKTAFGNSSDANLTPLSPLDFGEISRPPPDTG